MGNTKIRNEPKPTKTTQNEPNISETSQIITKPLKTNQIIANLNKSQWENVVQNCQHNGDKTNDKITKYMKNKAIQRRH